MCCGGREFEGEVRRGNERLTQHTDRSQGCYVSYLRVNRYPYNVSTSCIEKYRFQD